MDASNDWLARRGSEYIRLIRPLRAAVQWSYVSRREDADVTGNDLSDVGHISKSRTCRII